MGAMFCVDRSWASDSPASGNAISNAIAAHSEAADNTCEALKGPLCNIKTKAGSMQRFFCPRTCGIDNPTSGFAYQDSADGVPKVCENVLTEAMVSMDCQDLPTSHPAFKTYVDSLRPLLAPTFALFSAGNVTHRALIDFVFYDGMEQLGCSWASEPKVGADLTSGRLIPMAEIMCDPVFARRFGAIPNLPRSLRFLCPVTCNCTKSVKARYSSTGQEWTHDIGLLEHCPKKCFD